MSVLTGATVLPGMPGRGTLSPVADSGIDGALVEPVLRWYARNERPLPWRGAAPWAVLVSEVMLQQTPVDRVLPAWRRWLERWPTPPLLAAASPADAIRAWDRLGYPRRARYLHAAATRITTEHGGEVPDDDGALRALPGVGEYTAAAVRAFAFGRRAIVLDTNVRRVLARAVDGSARPAGSISPVEWAGADRLWPQAPARSARWSAAVMELGALVCTARAPRCEQCPIRRRCAWTARGRPPAAPVARPAYAGSDRQARGALLAVARDTAGSVRIDDLVRAWPDDEQRERALVSLVADGLLERRGVARVRLPR